MTLGLVALLTALRPALMKTLKNVHHHHQHPKLVGDERQTQTEIADTLPRESQKTG
jgi:hypothetical protein